jgi:hypothetical protein
LIHRRPPSGEEQLALKFEELPSDDRWVKSIIAALAGVIRDIKH